MDRIPDYSLHFCNVYNTFNKENSITSKDVAVITQEDLANQENTVENNLSNKNKFGKK